MLDIPEDDFSVEILPIIMPMAINKIAIIIDTSIAHSILTLKSRPKITFLKKTPDFGPL